MIRHASLFSQLIALFNRQKFYELVFRHKSERYSKGFNSWDQFVAMVFLLSRYYYDERAEVMFKKILCLFLIVLFLFPTFCYGDHRDHHDDDDIAVGIAIGAGVVLALVFLIVYRPYPPPPRPLPPPPFGFDELKKNSTEFKFALTPTYVGLRLEF